MGISRREFGKRSLFAIIAALFIPFISFGKESVKTVKKWILESLPGGIQLKHEIGFDKLVLSKYRHLLSPDNMVKNSVVEVWTNNRTGREYWNEDEVMQLRFKDFGVPKKWWRHYPLEDSHRTTYLVQWMQIEIQYKTEQEYRKNKNNALAILASLFNVAADKKLIGYGCLMPCFSFPVADLSDYKREMICVWPVGLRNLQSSDPWYMSNVAYYNDQLGVEVFCTEGELARIFIKSDGSFGNGVRDVQYPSANAVIEKMLTGKVEWIKS